MEAYDSNKTTK